MYRVMFYCLFIFREDRRSGFEEVRVYLCKIISIRSIKKKKEVGVR